MTAPAPVPRGRYSRRIPAGSGAGSNWEDVLQLKQEGTSSVLVTHNIYHGYHTADRFVVLSHGKKVMDAPKADTSIEELTRVIVASGPLDAE